VVTDTSRAVGDDRPTITRCLGIEPSVFARDYWDQQPFLGQQVAPDGFADLFSMATVDELLSRRGLRTPFLRVAKDGQVVPPGRFTGPGPAGAGIADQVDADRLVGLFADGSTLVLQGLHQVWPPIADLTSQLAAELGHPVQVNAYVTPPQSQGFAAHYDTHDVFVLQIAGAKRWQIWQPVLERPTADQPWNDNADAVRARATDIPLIDTVLRPGDALYLPRGFLHAATALGGTTVHLTLGIHPLTRLDVLRALIAEADDNPELRRALPIGDLAELGADVAATTSAAKNLLERADVASVQQSLAGRVRRDTRPAPVNPVAQAAAAAQVDPTSRVRMRARLRVDRRTAADTIQLRLRGRIVELPAATAPALDVLFDGKPHTVESLPGLDIDARIDLVQRLLREAVLVPDET
jgi:bifunctional lysine-specific demethylase and histidyl-hydroxylase NO66